MSNKTWPLNKCKITDMLRNWFKTVNYTFANRKAYNFFDISLKHCSNIQFKKHLINFFEFIYLYVYFFTV